ncbi:MAG: AMP-binding protein, partial [Blastococcus sp.]|nr:AMP-binding protein [Blastococcus sp.]
MPYPFDRSGTEEGPDGIRRYRDLPRNLPEILRSAVESRPDGEALVELGGERVTYRQLWDRAARVAGGLRAAGVKPGDRVANRLPNGNDWVYAFWGTLLAGAVVVPVNTRFAEPEVKYVVEDSGAVFVFEPGAALPDGDPLETTDQEHTDLAGIFYTSGTTGFPKGAMTTHENYVSNIETCLRCLNLGREPRTTLISVPLFHVTGCNSQLLVVAAVAGTSVIMPAFEVQAFLRAIQDERVDVLTTVPAIYWLALQQP